MTNLDIKSEFEKECIIAARALLPRLEFAENGLDATGYSEAVLNLIMAINEEKRRD